MALVGVSRRGLSPGDLWQGERVAGRLWGECSRLRGQKLDLMGWMYKLEVIGASERWGCVSAQMPADRPSVVCTGPAGRWRSRARVHLCLQTDRGDSLSLAASAVDGVSRSSPGILISPLCPAIRAAKIKIATTPNADGDAEKMDP